MKIIYIAPNPLKGSRRLNWTFAALAFVSFSSPPKPPTVRYWSDGHSIMFMHLSNVIDKNAKVD